MNNPFITIKVTEIPEGGFCAEYIPSFTSMDVKSKGDTIEECLENLADNAESANELLKLKTKEELIGQDYSTKEVKVDVKYEIHLTQSTKEKTNTNPGLKSYFQKIEKDYKAKFFYYT